MKNNFKRFMKLKPRYMLEKNDEGYTMCRMCGMSVLPPRRTMCSKECVHELRLRTSSRYVRDCLYMRDKGICCKCKIDTKKTAKTALSLDRDERKEFLKKYNISLKRKIWKRKHGGGLWDADHIIAVKDGGGCCGLDNYQTLCISCHKNKTFIKN